MAASRRPGLSLKLGSLLTLAVVGAMLASSAFTRAYDGTDASAWVALALVVALVSAILFAAVLDWLVVRPGLLRHEQRHSWQYAAYLGLPRLPLYGVATAWSLLRGGDVAVHNAFERWAGLEDGGYPTVSRRARLRRSAA